MHRFLDPDFDPTTGLLDPDEARHAVKSLRVKVGDEIEVCDGNGKLHSCRVAEILKRGLKLSVIGTSTYQKPKQKLYIAIAPTKNPSRFEWFVEKSTEMGIWSIIPISTERSERPRIKTDRLKRIATAASKQSLRMFIPRIEEITDLDEIIKSEIPNKYLAHCLDDNEKTELHHALEKVDGDTLVLIGPEGDFSETEIKKLMANGFQPVALGPNRLRTETAGIYTSALWSARLAN